MRDNKKAENSKLAELADQFVKALEDLEKPDVFLMTEVIDEYDEEMRFSQHKVMVKVRKIR